MSSRGSSTKDTGEWKSHTDPKSGRVYYYNTKTKESTWNKPLELATPDERRQMEQKKEETLKFFKDMELNIRYKLQCSNYNFESAFSFGIDGEEDEILYSTDINDFPREGRSRMNSLGSFDKGTGRPRLDSYSVPSRRVRTISTIDDEILFSMKQSNGDDRRTSMYNQNRGSYQYAEAKDHSPSHFHAEAKSLVSLKSEAKLVPTKRNRTETNRAAPKRRNSTGTIYVASTMSSQDNDATIHCVCIVIRAHMLTAAKENVVPLPEYDVFKDPDFLKSPTRREYKDANPQHLIPSLNAVKDFFTSVFSKSQLESDCIIMALIYCERLVKETKGRLCIRYDNWRSIVFACLVMASKVWDDLSMWNVDFSQVSTEFDLSRVNSLELAMLEALKYVIRVSASEYAKYYFHLRSMMVRLGLYRNEPNFIKPLDLDGARRLQLSTEKYQEMTRSPRKRHHSVHEHMHSLSLNRDLSDSSEKRSHYTPVAIEQLIHSEHMDADGQVHLKRKPSSQSMAPSNSSSTKSRISPIKVEHK